VEVCAVRALPDDVLVATNVLYGFKFTAKEIPAIPGI
jgi:hypothetical protein